MVTKYTCRAHIRNMIGKVKCAEISPDFPPNRSTQTCTDRATLIEHFFLTGEYLRSVGNADYQFPDGKDDGSEIDITRLQSVQAPDISSLASVVSQSLDKQNAYAVDSLKKIQKQKQQTVVNTKGENENE